MASGEWSLVGVHDVLAAAVPEREMVVCGPVRRTFAEVAGRTRALAAFLVARGLGARRERHDLERWESGQDAVAVVLHNSPEYLEALLGAMRARTVPFNVNQHYRPAEVGALLADLDTRAVVYHRALGPLVAAAGDTSGYVLVDVDDGSGVAPLPGSTNLEDAARTPVTDPLPDPSPALVSEVDRDQERFSSEAGGTFMPSLTDDSLATFRQMMLNMDHPRHTRLRRILQPIFTPRSIERLRASVASNADDVAAAVAGDVDLVEAVAAELPLRVLADLFGMPREDRHLIYGWSNALLGADNPGGARHAEDSMTALAGMMAYGQAMADDRRAEPRDDIVSRIVTAEVDGERLTDSEFQMFWLLLVVAGNETTRNGVSGSVIALHEHGLWPWLAARPEHLPTAVEELLRYVSPVQHFRRTATRDVVLGDQRVRAGDKVVIWFGAANRDPAVFADPHRLDLRRDPNPHLALGVGPHFCLGAHLARLEMAEMLRALLDHAPDLAVGEPGRIASNFINGVAHLPVSAGARAAGGTP